MTCSTLLPPPSTRDVVPDIGSHSRVELPQLYGSLVASTVPKYRSFLPPEVRGLKLHGVGLVGIGALDLINPGYRASIGLGSATLVSPGLMTLPVALFSALANDSARSGVEFRA